MSGRRRVNTCGRRRHCRPRRRGRLQVLKEGDDRDGKETGGHACVAGDEEGAAANLGGSGEWGKGGLRGVFRGMRVWWGKRRSETEHHQEMQWAPCLVRQRCRDGSNGEVDDTDDDTAPQGGFVKAELREDLHDESAGHAREGECKFKQIPGKLLPVYSSRQ